MKIRFKVNVLMLLMIYYCVFIDFPGFPLYNLLKYIFLVIVGLYLIANIRIMKKKEFLRIHIFLLLFALVTLFTSWVNRSVLKDRDPFLAAIVFVGSLAELYFLMEITARKGNGKDMINAFYVVTMTITVITDILILIGGYDGIRGEAQYLVGTKFDVAYLHLFLLALYMEKHIRQNLLQDKHKITMAILLGLTLFITILVNCTTGFVGILLFIIMIIVYKRHTAILYNPIVFLGVLAMGFLLSFVFELIVMWEPVEYILVHYLQRDITLSSRTKIFAAVPILLRGHYFWGFGYGTTYELGRKLGGFPNTQNALWEWIWQCGILGTVFLMILIGMVMFYVNKSKQLAKNSNSKYILILLYVFSILASVEITVNLSYLGYLAMLIPLTYINREK